MKESTDRKHFRFPVFSDKEGVKLSNQPKRKFFEDNEPTFITKYQTTNTNKINEVRHLDEINHQHDLNDSEENLQPTKEKNWQPKSVKKEKGNKGLAIKASKMAKEAVQKPVSTFASSYQPPINKRAEKEPKSWLPSDVEERIDKQTALEEKLANTRFAEDKDKFVPKSIPQQMYDGEDLVALEVSEKEKLAKQLADEKTDYLTLATDEEELSEVNTISEPEFDKISPKHEVIKTTTVYDNQEVTQRTKRDIPQKPKKNLLSDVKTSAFPSNKEVDTPVFKRKHPEEESIRTRLDKSLSGIISDEGQPTNSRYFDGKD